ncbi:hypothetical protein [Sphingomonas sp.]|uniref:hypothetical protein n=1 Tax=Sphingomonas sp. TaxID=28214 RepID=UPI0028A2850D|nr:hypothetical protein [Sphingomonas sp.]
MPEFMGKKITRTEEAARHAYRRALEKSLCTHVKGTEWKSAYGSIFREKAGWFICASPSVYIFEHVTKASITVKPMAIDPIFWDIVGLPENRDQPLSFRANRAWTCRPPQFADIPLEEDDDPAIVGKRLIFTATEQLESVIRCYSPERFLNKIHDADSMDGSHLASIIPTLISLDRQHEALAICDEACSKGWNGGFLAPEGSFAEMAASYLRKSIADATRH